MKGIFFFISTFFLFATYAQDSLLVGKKYFEDQIYFAITNNSLTNKPDGLVQKGMSTAVQLGVIKDLPINKEGSLAIGIGLGYVFNTYKQNLKISAEESNYTLIYDLYNTNRIDTHSIELPIELRVRLTSTPTVYRFWRIYFGGKIRYVFASKSIFNDDQETLIVKNLANINKWQYGPQLAVGYNALNFYLFYNFQSLFVENKNELPVNQMKSLSFGFQFYVF
jgi:hypothetical protein